MTKKVNEFELSYEGCYGMKVSYEQLSDFLLDSFAMNEIAEQTGGERFAICLWGHAGTGKTQFCKQFADREVVWNGEKYSGYEVFDVPIAQFEEMGDLHGLPDRHILLRKGDSERWVPEEVMSQYVKLGWEVDAEAGVRTMYAPPDWVPQKPGPSILLLDDWNRTSIRVVKGCMQLFQNFGMVSWQLPPGCNIVMTGNPDRQDYMVTSIDSAMLTRIRSVTLKWDANTAKEWALWAQGAGIDERGISFVLKYPEMALGRERTNPRTLTQFFRFLKTVGKIENERERVAMQAHALLDEETISALFVFFEREMELISDPEDILKGDDHAFQHVRDLMSRKERRIDILGVICERLYVLISQESCKQTPERVKNFQKFITMDCVPDDMRHGICRRIAKSKDRLRGFGWLKDNKMLKELILDTLRH